MKNLYKEHKKVLGLHMHIDWLSIAEKEIVSTFPNILFYAAYTYEKGLQLMLSYTFDLVVMGKFMERRNGLLELARKRDIPILLLGENGHPCSDEGSDITACTSFPKVGLDEIVTGVANALNGGSHRKKEGVLKRIISPLNGLVVRLSPKKIDRRNEVGVGSSIYY